MGASSSARGQNDEPHYENVSSSVMNIQRAVMASQSFERQIRISRVRIGGGGSRDASKSRKKPKNGGRQKDGTKSLNTHETVAAGDEKSDPDQSANDSGKEKGFRVATGDQEVVGQAGYAAITKRDIPVIRHR